MKLSKGTLVAGLLLSGVSYGVPYEISNPLDPAWHSLVNDEDEYVCINQDELIYRNMCRDDEIQAQEEHEFEMTEKDLKDEAAD